MNHLMKGNKDRKKYRWFNQKKYCQCLFDETDLEQFSKRTESLDSDEPRRSTNSRKQQFKMTQVPQTPCVHGSSDDQNRGAGRAASNALHLRHRVHHQE